MIAAARATKAANLPMSTASASTRNTYPGARVSTSRPLPGAAFSSTRRNRETFVCKAAAAVGGQIVSPQDLDQAVGGHRPALAEEQRDEQ
ncbi:hypothetical protein GCM10020220_106670 [Nonomuraea rubra]|uniref:hypothetical protein n=1 Tax=Nonomuraea rubra TaxID=46180 RepID=UPI0031EB5CB8